MRTQSFEALLRLTVERVVGRAHIRELRIRAHGRYHAGEQHGVAACGVLKRRIRMPKAVAKSELALAVIAREERAVRANIGYVGHGFDAEPVLRDRSCAGLRMQASVQPACKIELLLDRERLIAEHEHGE